MGSNILIRLAIVRRMKLFSFPMDEAQVIRGLLDFDAGASTSCGSSCLLVLKLERSTAKLSERSDLMMLRTVSDWLNEHVAGSGSSGTRARSTTFLFCQLSARPTQPIGKRYQRRAEAPSLAQNAVTDLQFSLPAQSSTEGHGRKWGEG